MQLTPCLPLDTSDTARNSVGEVASVVAVCEPLHTVLLDVLHAVCMLYVPQLEHTMQEDAPAADIEYVPSAHDTHSGLPSRLSAYLPAGQLWHTAEEVLPTMSEYVPTEHEEHCKLPEAAEKLPAGHGGQLVLPNALE
jgi:hypothetical protein